MISTAEIEQIIREYLPSETGFAAKEIEAMNYSVLAGGKRIRPRLIAETYAAFGGTEEVYKPFMAAMEILHSYSLVHDDLPCMDNDTLRRGKPTTWSAYGEAAGVLAGDGLLNCAYETALKAFSLTAFPERVIKALQIFAHRSGIRGMVGGQSLDVAKNGENLSREELDFIYRLKTGALIEASLMIGAALAGADEEGIAAAERVGGAIGYAFQIRDDILDVTADEAKLGKPVGSDARNQKTTYVTLYGLSAAQEKVESLTAEGISELKHFPQNTGFFKDFLQKLATRNY